MSIDHLAFRICGAFILAGLALSQLHWLCFTALVGANMLKPSVTGFCPSAKIL